MHIKINNYRKKKTLHRRYRHVSGLAQSELVLHNNPVLPLIDFSAFVSKDETNHYPHAIIEKLANACEHVGFFYAIGHGISNELLLRTLSVTRQLFDLDLKIKNQYASRLFVNSSNINYQSGGLGRGYQSIGENVTNSRRDRHEGFDLYRELDSNHPLRLQFNEKNLTNKTLPDYREMAIGWNLWPKELPLFKETITEYTTAMLQAGARVMRAIALSLNLPLNYFESTFNDSFWVIRCIRYPPVSQNEIQSPEYGEGCGEHSDYGWLTFVNQDLDSHNCLHVRTNDRSKATYISADPIVVEEQIALTCNIGDIIAFITKNKYRSTRHCVVSPVKPARSRISTPFFFEPNLDVKLRINETSPECYYGEYLISKIRTLGFATRGSVLDLAIGIVIGTAFTNVVQSLVDDIITPPLGLLLGGVDFANLTIKMKNFVYTSQPPVVVRYGKFIQSCLALLIIAMALFCIIKAINHLYKIAAKKKEKKETDGNIQVTEEVKVLREIRDLLAGKSFARQDNVVDLDISIIVGTYFINVDQLLLNNIIIFALRLIVGGVDFANDIQIPLPKFEIASQRIYVVL
ncbi:unnamed protein product [Rotaria sordida]|uniref:Fe2OG dioxygenase domain-containing protein n=1 Tax=Rotaria sordida TaxID=392033 RepID=A0A818WIZ3_9BILA|nr:unnamed protein product [Rotaria sordida]